MHPKHVLIVDDHPIFRDALDVALGRTGSTKFDTMHAGTLGHALTILGHSEIDLILLDLNLGDTEGFDGLTRLLAAAKGAKVAVVSATENPHAFATAKTLGACAYLPKSLPLDDLTSGTEALDR